MKYTTEEINAIKENFLTRIDELTTKEFSELSNSEMSWLKGVAVSSIMTMKKKGYSNDQIMTTHQREKQTDVQKVGKVIVNFTDEQLKELGLSRI
jgi:methyltransferase-like protein